MPVAGLKPLAAALALCLPLLAAEGAGASPPTAHDFTFTSIEGKPLHLSEFRGKAMLVVNTASMCGFTAQYRDLQALWERYRDRGLVVLGVPSGDFGGQELRSSAEIKEFCEVNFAVDFPMTEKVSVRGAQAHPFYRWVVEKKGVGAAPGWNFHKYVVTPDGCVAAVFPSAVPPGSPRVIEAIEAALPAR